MSIQLTEEEWKQKLTPEQYHVLREKGTEVPGTGKLLHNEKTGEYTCAGCGNVVFKSDSKYESTMPGLIGWPSFAEAASEGAVKSQPDDSSGMSRTEVICANCGGHLGHLFDDPTSPNGKHYCINSGALNFEAKS
jgi:peptide-methionine (R)-S-oxide reductase